MTHKVPSDNPSHYTDAAAAGARALLSLAGDEPIPGERVEAVRMGTTGTVFNPILTPVRGTAALFNSAC